MPRKPRDAQTVDPVKVAADLRVALSQLVRRLRQQSSIGDFTRSQLSVLARLDREGPTTMTTLARAEGIRPQSMGAIVSVLDAAGLVAGTPDPSDGRKTVLSLTDTAREQFTSDRLAREDWLFRAIRTELSQSEQDELARLAELLRRLASSP